MCGAEKSIAMILPDVEVVNFLKTFLETRFSRVVALVVCPQKYTTIPDGEKLIILTVEDNPEVVSSLENSIEFGLLSAWKPFIVEAKMNDRILLW
jgi:hypothetical protein